MARACDGFLSGKFAALLTGPVHMGIINDNGLPFSGHIKYYTERSGRDRVIMILANESLRGALATTHLPLLAVPSAITRQSLDKVITILIQDLKRQIRYRTDVHLCLRAEPYAAKAGKMGREEIEVITPALDTLRAKGYNFIGLLPADTLFQPKYLQQANVVLAMYHDQGLAVMKYGDEISGIWPGVNITLGLPSFLPTSTTAPLCS